MSIVLQNSKQKTQTNKLFQSNRNPLTHNAKVNRLSNNKKQFYKTQYPNNLLKSHSKINTAYKRFSKDKNRNQQFKNKTAHTKQINHQIKSKQLGTQIS